MQCNSCSNQAEPKRTRCRDCLNKCSEYCEGRVARGECRQCGRKRERADRTLCDECGDAAAERVRLKRLARIKAGVCVALGCKRKPTRGQMCKTHRLAQGDHERATRDRKRGTGGWWTQTVIRRGWAVLLSPKVVSLHLKPHGWYTSPTVKPPAVRPRRSELIRLADLVIAEHKAFIGRAGKEFRKIPSGDQIPG